MLCTVQSADFGAWKFIINKSETTCAVNEIYIFCVVSLSALYKPQGN